MTTTAIYSQALRATREPARTAQRRGLRDHGASQEAPGAGGTGGSNATGTTTATGGPNELVALVAFDGARGPAISLNTLFAR
jgi:hypothetical protein